MSEMKHRSNEARGRVENDNRGHDSKRFEVPAGRNFGEVHSRLAEQRKSAGPNGEASC